MTKHLSSMISLNLLIGPTHGAWSLTPQNARKSRKRHPGNANYSMLGETLEEVKENKYLGVMIQNNLKWDKQSHHAANRATRMLNFIHRNFHHCSKSTKENLYLTFIQPHLEYGSAAWNPGIKGWQLDAFSP